MTGVQTCALPILDLRLRNAPAELEDYAAFQYVILNDDLDRAVNQMSAIVHAERARLSRQAAQIRRVVEAFTADEMPDSLE